MNDNALIKIRVTETNNKVSYGTGYRINHSHVLTALHVLDDDDGKTCFEFHFPQREQPISEYSIAYSNDDYDIALVTFSDEVLTSLEKMPTVEITPADSNTKWDGFGYPKFAESDEEDDSDRVPESIKGGCYNCTKDNPFFQVDCNKHVKIKKWGGISGASLFDRRNKKLIGIVTSVDSAVDNTHFDVSAIWKLLKDKDFLGYFTKKISLKKIHQLSQDMIDDLELKAPFKKFGETSKEIVEHLTAQELSVALDSLEKAKKKSTYKEAINQFSLQFLPHYFADQAVVIDKALVTACEGAIDLECVSDIAAECSMASFAGRAAEFERVTGQSGAMDYLKVTGAFAVEPESGIDQGKADINAVTSQVLSTAALDLELQQRFAQGTVKPEEAVNTTLAYYKQKKGYRYYFVVRLDKNTADYNEKAKKLMSYKAKYPDLIIINLSSDGTLEHVERMHFELPLIDLLE